MLKKERERKRKTWWWWWGAEKQRKKDLSLRTTNLTNVDNHGTLKHGRLKRNTTPQLISSTKLTDYMTLVFLIRLHSTWSLEVDPA